MRLVLGVGALWVALAGVAAAQTKPAALLPAPEAAAIAKSREMIKGVFKDEFSKTAAGARQALARRLVTEAAATKDDVSARYVLLMDGADMAAAAGDCETAIKALSELGRLYAVEVLDLKKAALMRVSGMAMTPDTAELLMRLCLETADAAVLADAFDIVQSLTNVAEAAANKTRKVSVVAGIQTRLADLRGLATEFLQVRMALDVLVKKPDDAAAHLVVGRFYALHKGQWEAGLPHLAGCGDAELRALAAKELAAPTEGLDQTALGDAWWDLAEKSTGLARVHAGKHAVMWYEQAEKSLSGITLARVQKRLKAGLPAGAATEPARNGAKVVAATSVGGPSVNLLALIDPSKDGAEGKWSMESGALVAAPGKYSVLQLPYMPPEEYDIRVAFTRTEGEGPINVLLAAHKKAFGFALDVKGEARFERVGNKIAKDNPTTVPVVVTNGKKYLLTVQVRKDGLKALLDDKVLATWKTDYKDLARYTVWKMPDEKLCGLGANASKVIFHSVEMVEVAGTGKAIR